MQIIAFVLFITYILYLIYENAMNKKYRLSFKYIVHVNGIRGKTSVCRLVDSGLRSGGYKVYTKTTGTAAMIIDTYGNETAISRHSPANIKEQLKIIKKAYKEKADVLVLECMAVKPELQDICQNKIIGKSITVITNVRYDHLSDMGETLDDIAISLSETIPLNGILFTSEKDYFNFFKEICEQKNCKIYLSEDVVKYNNINDIYSINDENIIVAKMICNYIGINDELFYKSIENVKKDFGSYKMYEIKCANNVKASFLNLFSVNDPISTKNILNKYFYNYENICFLYNNRNDRPDRLKLFADKFIADYKYDKIFVMGENKLLAKMIFSRKNFKNIILINKYNEIIVEKERTLIVGIGNIKCKGYDMIKHIEGDLANE